MWDAIEKLDCYLFDCFGESGASCFHDAVLFYLDNCPADKFPGGEHDKFILLCYVAFSKYSDKIFSEYNPFLNMTITFDKLNSPPSGEDK